MCSFTGHSEISFAHLCWLQMAQVASLTSAASRDFFFFLCKLAFKTQILSLT